MHATAIQPLKTNPLSAALGVIAVLLVAGVLTNLSSGIGISDRVAFIALAVIGFTMCSLSMRIATFGWLNPFTIAGAVLGTLLLVFIAAVLMDVQLPWITSDRAAIIALAALMVGKMVLAGVRGRVAQSFVAHAR